MLERCLKLHLDKIISAELEAIAVKPDGYPEANLPEIALAGRSNVGKSSFTNAIMNRKALARTSGKPGKTRTINFYNINNQVRLVDLPGYGYAATSQDEKDRWADYINTYLETRENLKAIFLIVDIRHEPTALDCAMYDYIVHTGIDCVIIATKADKIAKGKYQQAEKVIRKKLKAVHPVVPFSSSNKYGIDEAKALISQYI